MGETPTDNGGRSDHDGDITSGTAFAASAKKEEIMSGTAVKGVSVSAAGAAGLAATGVNVWPLVIIAAILMIAGMVALRVARPTDAGL